jgi:hypothetical protein
VPSDDNKVFVWASDAEGQSYFVYSTRAVRRTSTRISTVRQASNQVVSTGGGRQSASCVLHRRLRKSECRLGDQGAAYDALAVATFVPAEADICSFLKAQTAPYIRKLLIRMTPNNDLRIRNAWVRGSNPLCGTIKKIQHIRDASVLARGFTVATFVPERAWVGTACHQSHL